MNNASSPYRVVALLILATGTLHAQDGTWIHNGNGNWSDSARWSGGTIASGTDFTAFFTAELTGNRTVTVDTARTIGNITFTDTTPSHNLTIAGTGANILTLDRTGVGLSSPVIDVTQAGRTLQINAQISGDDGFTKSGDGILILNNNSNNYTGKTIVTGGVLQIGTGHSSGQLSVPGGYTSNPVTGSNIELNGGILSYWFAFNRSLGTGDGQIQLTGGRSGFTQKQGDRFDLTFGTAGSEIQWGSAEFNPTTLVLNDSAAGAANVIKFNNALDLNGADRTIETASTALSGRADSFSRILETGAFLDYNIRNTSGTAAGLIKTGAGKLGLDGTNTYDGGTTISEGGLFFDRLVSMPASGAVTVASGAELIVTVGEGGSWTTGTSGAGTLGGLFAGDGGQSASQVSYGANVTIGVNVTNNQTYAGDLANATGTTTTNLSLYADDGSGQLTLTGNNTYTGTTTLYEGADLEVGSAGALGGGGDITFAATGTSSNVSELRYTAASAGIDYGSRIKNSGGVIGLNTNGQNVSISGIDSSNTGGLLKQGAGTLTFTGTNTYSGITTINDGTFAVYDGTLSTGQVNMTSNTTVSIVGGSGVTSTWDVGNQQFGTPNGSQTNIQVLIDGDGVAGSALLTNVGNLVFGKTAANSNFIVTDGGQVNVNGDIRIGDTYYNTLGNTTMTIGGGTATSTVTGNNQSLFIGYGEREGASNNTVTVTDNGVLTNVGNIVVGHVFNAQGNDQPATANKLTVTGTGTASGTTLSVGWIQSGSSPGWQANANVVEVTNGGTLSTTGTSYIGRTDTVDGSIANENTVTITGTGSSWDAGNQTIHVGYTNNRANSTSNDNILTIGTGASVTNVSSLIVGSGSAGTHTGNQLIVNGSLSATSITISDGNSLSGSGTITTTGLVTVNGALTPGNSPGVLSFGNDLVLGGTAATTMELDGTARGTGYDGVDVTNALTYGGSLSFDLLTVFGAGSYTFDIFGFGSQSGDFASVAMTGLYTGSFSDMGGGVWSLVNGTDTWTFTQSTGDLGLVVVPEPSAALLGMLGVLGLLVRRKR